MKKLIAIFIVAVLSTMTLAPAEESNVFDCYNSKIPIIPDHILIGEDMSGFTYGAILYGADGEKISTGISMKDLADGVFLRFTNLTYSDCKFLLLLLSGGQPQLFEVDGMSEAIQYEQTIPANSSIYIPISAYFSNSLPANDFQFMFILNIDDIPKNNTDDICFYSFSHSFIVNGNTDSNLLYQVCEENRAMTSYESSENGTSFVTVANIIVNGEQVTGTCFNASIRDIISIQTHSYGQDGVYSRLMFIDDTLAYVNGKTCSRFILTDGTTYDSTYDLTITDGDVVVYFVTVETGVDGWRAQGSSKVRIVYDEQRND